MAKNTIKSYGNIDISDYAKFFNRNSEEVAQDLLGRIILRVSDRGASGAQISATGAYNGVNSITPRKGMNYTPGTIFLMPWRGSYLFNITTENEGSPSCVEVREISFHDRRIIGSGKITNELQLNLDGVVLGNEVKIIGEAAGYNRIRKTKGVADNCLGYFKIK